MFERDAGDDPRGLGLSELAYEFIGGLKANAKAYIAVTAPTVNSYKRLVVGRPHQRRHLGTGYVSYGYNNRTQMLRIPAAGRIEDRTVDGSCNPYLAATAMLAAGLDGIERDLDPGDPTPRTCTRCGAAEREAAGIETLPGTCSTRRASWTLRRACAGLGKNRQRRLPRLLRHGQAPRGQAAHEQITQWELDRYLQLY